MMHSPTNEKAPESVGAVSRGEAWSGEARRHSKSSTQLYTKKQSLFTQKEALREALPFTRLMSHYGLEVLPHEQVRCPLHGKDKRPSATIKGNFFHCFACGASFDVFGFIQEMERCSFPEALRVAADISGFQLSSGTAASRQAVGKAIQKRVHDASERRRVSLSAEQKYSLLLKIARTVREREPEWLPQLDSLLDDWLHGVPDDVDLRPLLNLAQRGQFTAMGPVIGRLHAEQAWRADHD